MIFSNNLDTMASYNAKTLKKKFHDRKKLFYLLHICTSVVTMSIFQKFGKNFKCKDCSPVGQQDGSGSKSTCHASLGLILLNP